MALVLAVVIGAGGIPIPEATSRFPDPKTWPGTGLQRVQNMLSEVRESQGNQLATSGPGPQQIMARWRAGSLNGAERVAVLLGSPVFHDAAVLPMYAEALRSSVLRERLAAVTGLAWLIGVPAPDPTTLGEADEIWDQQRRLADALVWATREKSLVRVWVDSIFEAKNVASTGAGLTLRVGTGQALAAIRDLAQPEDVNDLLALWPILDTGEQQQLLYTIETVTLQQFFVRPPTRGQRSPSGKGPYLVAREQAGSWVASVCAEIDGPAAVFSRIWRLAEGHMRHPNQAEALVLFLNQDYEPLWVVPSQLLVPLGASAVQYDRQLLHNPGNSELRSRVRKNFGVSRFASAPVRPGRDRRPARPSPRR